MAEAPTFKPPCGLAGKPEYQLPPSDRAIQRLVGGGLRNRLLVLVLVTVLPMLLMTAVIINRSYSEPRADAEQRLVLQAIELAKAIDQIAREAMALAEGLSASPALRSGDMSGFLAEVAAMESRHPGIAFTFHDHDTPDGDGAAGVPEPFGPRLSSLFRPGAPGAATLGISIPAGTGGTIDVVIDPSRLQRLVQELELPPDWLAGMHDQNERMGARNIIPNLYFDIDSKSAVREQLITVSSGFVHALTLEGVPSSMAFARAPMTGFVAILSIPSAQFDEPYYNELLSAGMVGLAVTALSLGLALLLANRVSRSLRGVSSTLATGAEPAAGFAKVVELARALQLASQTVTGQHDAYRDAMSNHLVNHETNMRQVLDAMPLTVMVSGADGANIFANKYARDMFPDHLTDLRIDRDTLIHPDDKAAIAAWRRNWRAGECSVEVVIRFLNAGRYRWHLIRGVVSPGLPGQPVRYVGISLDIHDTVSARLDLQQQVAERTRELSETAAQLSAELVRREKVEAALLQSQKVEALGRLAGGVAHDVNNVLTVLANGFCTIEQATSEPAVRKAVAIGQLAVSHAAGLMRHMLAFARQQTLATGPVDVAGLLTEFAPLYRQALGTDIDLRLDIVEELPLIYIDNQMLQAALLNLVCNARDAMPQGGSVIIAVRGLDADALSEVNDGSAPALSQPAGVQAASRVTIAVRDTGCGMTEDVISRVMEPYFTTHVDGMAHGLGLAIVHGFVAQSHGSIHIESISGQGTSVTLTLPVSSIADEPLPSPSCSRLNQVAHELLILLVDDHPAVRLSTAMLLRTAGHAVIEAANAAEAEELARNRCDIDLVITDIVMPGGSGVALADRIKALRPGLPVVLITGYAGIDHSTVGHSTLNKPFKMQDLLDTIDSVTAARFL